MVKGAYQHIGEAFRNVSREDKQTRMVAWRASEAAVVVDKPLNLNKARMLGYKAKKGFVVIRIRVNRGGRSRPRHAHGRKSRKQHESLILKMSYRWVAEIRASKKYPNLEVLNSYYLGKDGKHYFFEVIMVDTDKPEIMNDKDINWICQPEMKGRAERGLTSAGKKSRGMSTKKPNMKVRPSLRAWNRQGK